MLILFLYLRKEIIYGRFICTMGKKTGYTVRVFDTSNFNKFIETA